MLLVAVAALAVTAFAGTSLASASEWKKEGKTIEGSWTKWSSEGAPLTSEAILTLSGKTKTSSIHLGGIECTVSEKLALTPGGSIASISGVTLSGCVTSGVISFEGCSVSSATANGASWNATANPNGEFLSTFNVTYNVTGESSYCKTRSTLTVEGTSVKATIDNPDAMSTLTQNGKATLTLGKEPVNITGVLNVSPAKKYGIINAYTVKLTSPAWTMTNPGLGNFVCEGIVGNLALEAGGKGQITSLSGSNCHGSTSYFCGKWSIRASAPWSVTDEGTYIKIPAASLAVDQPKSAGCESEFTRVYTGELKMTPTGSTSAITSANIAGYLQEGTGVGWNVSSTTLNWAPSGVYGL
jgi:hypothetical protein